MEASQSFARHQQRPNQASVRSTTLSPGDDLTKPVTPSGRLTISMTGLNRTGFAGGEFP